MRERERHRIGLREKLILMGHRELWNWDGPSEIARQGKDLCLCTPELTGHGICADMGRWYNLGWGGFLLWSQFPRKDAVRPCTSQHTQQRGCIRAWRRTKQHTKALPCTLCATQSPPSESKLTPIWECSWRFNVTNYSPAAAAGLQVTPDTQLLPPQPVPDSPHSQIALLLVVVAWNIIRVIYEE